MNEASVRFALEDILNMLDCFIEQSGIHIAVPDSLVNKLPDPKAKEYLEINSVPKGNASRIYKWLKEPNFCSEIHSLFWYGSVAAALSTFSLSVSAFAVGKTFSVGFN